jgi:hypothetical protein
MHTIKTQLTRATGRLESICVGIMDDIQSFAVELQTSQGQHRYSLQETGVSSKIDYANS